MGEVTREPSLSVHRVLVVDDNQDAAEMLVEALQVMGHKATAAHDGYRALEVAVRFRPDVALLDIGLPGMDGFELAGKLRALEGLQALRLIAVTGYGQPSDRELSKAAGFDVHVVKPLPIKSLAELLG